MARFADDKAVYSQLGRLFEELLADPATGDRVRALGAVIQFKLLKPDSQITLNIGEDAPGTVEFGITPTRPAVVLLMDAETAHRFWSGRLALNVALAEGRISAQGPVATILGLVPLVKPAAAIYARLTGDAPSAPAPDDTAADDTPADDTPAQDTPADDTPADDTPADEAPAAEAEADAEPAAEAADPA